MSVNKNIHLTLNERSIIQTGIRNGSTKASIADTLGKDKSTIGKEIKLHRIHKHRCLYDVPCVHFPKCPDKHHCANCERYQEFKCARRDRTPGACNGCSNYTHCRYDKYIYDAEIADSDYKSTLVDSRTGINMTYSELEKLAKTVVPLVKQGQSPAVIVKNHPELEIGEKTLYNYISSGYFHSFGLIDMDLRQKVKRKISKKELVQYKKREDHKYLQNRLYKDYLLYIEEYPYAKVVQMDTVYNDGTNGPFMQTFRFMKYNFTLVIFQEEKTADSMVNGVNLLEATLGTDLFRQEVQVILTDRGSEFVYATELEKSAYDNIQRTRVFYCDPMASCQKGSLENSHHEIRQICPKETDLYSLGLTSQDKANIITSHINSYTYESIEYKSPIEVMKFYNKELWDKLNSFGILEIEKDKVTLKPYLLK